MSLVSHSSPTSTTIAISLQSSRDMWLAEEAVQPICQRVLEMTIGQEDALTSHQLHQSQLPSALAGLAEQACQLSASQTGEIQPGETINNIMQPGYA